MMWLDQWTNLISTRVICLLNDGNELQNALIPRLLSLKHLDFILVVAHTEIWYV